MTALQGLKSQILWTSTPNVAMTDQALTDSGDHTTFNISNAATKRIWDRTAAFVIQAEYDEVQTVTITGAPTGGTFTLTFGANTTAVINWNDPASTVQTRLQALASIGAGNALVTGSAGGPYTVEFASSLGFASQALITLGTNSLTGGASPNVAIARTQAGAGWTTQAATTYTLQYAGGHVVFNAAFLGTSVGCRVHSGAYLPYSAIADAVSWEADLARDVKETTTLTTTSSPTRWKTFKPGLVGGTYKINKWLADPTNIGLFNVSTADTLVSSFVLDVTAGTPTRLESFGYLTKDSIKTMINAIETDDLEFVIDGGFYVDTV